MSCMCPAWSLINETVLKIAVLCCDVGQSVRHHLLTNYFHAILAVVLAQFTGLGFLDGMEGVIRLAEASPYIKVGPLNLSLLMPLYYKTISRRQKANAKYTIMCTCFTLAKLLCCCALHGLLLHYRSHRNSPHKTNYFQPCALGKTP